MVGRMLQGTLTSLTLTGFKASMRQTSRPADFPAPAKAGSVIAASVVD